MCCRGGVLHMSDGPTTHASRWQNSSMPENWEKLSPTPSSHEYRPGNSPQYRIKLHRPISQAQAQYSINQGSLQNQAPSSKQSPSSEQNQAQLTAVKLSSLQNHEPFSPANF